MSHTIEISDQSAQFLKEIATTTKKSEAELVELALRMFFRRDDNASILTDWEYVRQHEVEFGPLQPFPDAPPRDMKDSTVVGIYEIAPERLRRYGEECCHRVTP